MIRKGATYRLDPVVHASLSKLSQVLGRPLNQLVNEAVSDFVAKRSKEVAADLGPTLEKLRAYRKSDPNFERAITDYVDAEAALKEDPAEGQRVVDVGPAQEKMLKQAARWLTGTTTRPSYATTPPRFLAGSGTKLYVGSR